MSTLWSPNICRFLVYKHLFLLKPHSCSFKKVNSLSWTTYKGEGIQCEPERDFFLAGTELLLASNHSRRLDGEEKDQVQIRKDKMGRIWSFEKDEAGKDSLVSLFQGMKLLPLKIRKLLHIINVTDMNWIISIYFTYFKKKMKHSWLVNIYKGENEKDQETNKVPSLLMGLYLLNVCYMKHILYVPIWTQTEINTERQTHPSWIWHWTMYVL